LKIPDFRLKMGIPPINRGRLAYLFIWGRGQHIMPYASMDIRQVTEFVNGVLKYCSVPVVDGIVQDSNPHNYAGQSDIAPQATHILG
jgi:hypothetical protein